MTDKVNLIKAEIVRLIKHSEMVADHNTQITELVSRELDTLYHLISFTNSLEVKEVDLDLGSPEGDIGVKTIWDGDNIMSSEEQKEK